MGAEEEDRGTWSRKLRTEYGEEGGNRRSQVDWESWIGEGIAVLYNLTRGEEGSAWSHGYCREGHPEGQRFSSVKKNTENPARKRPQRAPKFSGRNGLQEPQRRTTWVTLAVRVVIEASSCRPEGKREFQKGNIWQTQLFRQRAVQREQPIDQKLRTSKRTPRGPNHRRRRRG